MRIFVTGAAGFVGSAVVSNLTAAGHDVVGLVRSGEAAGLVANAGAVPFLGDLNQINEVLKQAITADAIVHTAFNHDFSRFKENCEADKRIIQAFGGALRGTSKKLVVTSAIGILPTGEMTTELTRPTTGANAHPRVASEEAAAALCNDVHISVVRLPPSVHGHGDRAFLPTLIGIAKQRGMSAFIEQGHNLWPAVHRLDAADLFRRVVERGLPGARYHGVAEEGILFRAIAEAIGHNFNLPVRSVKRGDAPAHFGNFKHFASMNLIASSRLTREQLNWTPVETGLIADLAGTAYADGEPTIAI